MKPRRDIRKSRPARRLARRCAACAGAAGRRADRALPPTRPWSDSPCRSARQRGRIRRSDFVNADLEAVVRAGRPVHGPHVRDRPAVKGTLTLITERPVTRQQAFEETAVGASACRASRWSSSNDAGGVARILPEADAKLHGRARGYAWQGMPRAATRCLTQVFRLQYESATNLCRCCDADRSEQHDFGLPGQ